MNVITQEMQKEKWHVLDDIEADDSIKVIILTGAGEAFSGGHDIGSFDTGPADIRKTIEFGLERLNPRLVNFAKPIISAINGLASGGGAEYALMSDIIIASEEAKFSFLGATLGIVSIRSHQAS